MFWIIRYSFKTPNHFLSLKGRKLQLFVCPKEIILNANQIYQIIDYFFYPNNFYSNYQKTADIKVSHFSS